MPQRGETLFDSRCRSLLLLQLDPGSDMQRLHYHYRGHVVVLAPGEEVRHRTAVSPPRVRVPDPRGEEFQKSDARSIAACGDQCRQHIAAGGDGDLALMGCAMELRGHRRPPPINFS